MKLPKTGFRLFVGFVVVMVSVAAAIGLYLAGSPTKERERRFDDQRVNDLQSIASAIDLYYENKNVLPVSIPDLMSAQQAVGGFYIQSITDPSTAKPYEYQVTGVVTYNLCATFDGSSTDAENTSRAVKMSAPYPILPVGRDWNHAAGYVCYPLTAQIVTGTTCGLRSPCSAGLSCITLPSQPGAVCAPQGKECLAAGCENDCVLTESYPAQVTCTVKK